MELGLGARLRDMRQQKNLTQEELADRCELTKTLCDLLNALGSSLSEFFRESDEEKIVFSEEEYIEKQSEGMTLDWVIPNAQKNMMEPVLVTLEPGASTQPDFPHEGEEFGFVLEGKLSVIRDKKSYPVKKGESFYYAAGKEHYIVNRGKTRARFLWISTPPNF